MRCYGARERNVSECKKLATNDRRMSSDYTVGDVRNENVRRHLEGSVKLSSWAVSRKV
jgi:hypothetical protein